MLEDLLTYVFSGQNNKLVLVGDTAQLPPVGLPLSPALDPEYIKSMMHGSLFDFEMTEVMRQSIDSGILLVATGLRKKIAAKNSTPPFFRVSDFKSDIRKIDNGYEMEELLQHTFSGGELEEGIVVCRSNKRANLFNQQIRSHILQRESDIEGGDSMMVVKNNYFWMSDNELIDFIANGDIFEILKIYGYTERYGRRFAGGHLPKTDNSVLFHMPG